MLELNRSERETFIQILIRFARVNTAIERENFLEAAGLYKFYALLSEGTNKANFCRELVRTLSYPTAITDEGEYALLCLLKYLKKEVIVGHPDSLAFIEHLLASFAPKSISSPQIQRTSSTHLPRSFSFVLWIFLLGVMVFVVVTTSRAINTFNAPATMTTATIYIAATTTTEVIALFGKTT